MTLETFITTLNAHKGKSLLFEYSNNQFAGTNYHLTEVKNATFETVDCGGNINNWQETQLQLWESASEKGKTDYMTVDKVLDILNRVDTINPLWKEKEVKVEFGNENFHTSIMNIASFKINDTQLIASLFSEKTGCKAPTECVIENAKETVSSCCEPASKCC
ncbi:MAG: DUF6428 family protein [Flavobacteriaceae bacterium]